MSATLEYITKLERVAEAAKWANWCPDAGGYKDGRSVEDCYEELHYALCDLLGTSLDVPNYEWMTEEELEAAISKARGQL